MCNDISESGVCKKIIKDIDNSYIRDENFCIVVLRLYKISYDSKKDVDVVYEKMIIPLNMYQHILNTFNDIQGVNIYIYSHSTYTLILSPTKDSIESYPCNDDNINILESINSLLFFSNLLSYIYDHNTSYNFREVPISFKFKYM